MALLLADFHLHIHRIHQREILLNALFANFARIAARLPVGPAPLVRAAFLADRRRSQLFSEWRRGLFRIRGYSATPVDPHTLLIQADNGDRVYLFAGRQIATREGLELLSLATESDIPDAMPFAKAVEHMRREDGLPVLPWAPGKWAGARGKLVRAGIQALAPHGLLLCDPAVRPAGTPEPGIYRQARRLQVPLVAGSDPYPFPGEESLAGSYAALLEGPFDPDHPAATIRDLLRLRPPVPCRLAGRRSNLFTAARRWLTHFLGYHRPQTF